MLLCECSIKCRNTEVTTIKNVQYKKTFWMGGIYPLGSLGISDISN